MFLVDMWGPSYSVEVMCVNFQLGVKHNVHPVDE